VFIILLSPFVVEIDIPFSPAIAFTVQSHRKVSHSAGVGLPPTT